MQKFKIQIAKNVKNFEAIIIQYFKKVIIKNILTKLFTLPKSGKN